MAKPTSLEQLASVLQPAPRSDALPVLGKLLDSLPIGFYITDCQAPFRILYANRAWERWLPYEKVPSVGKYLSEIFPAADETGVLPVLSEVCARGQSNHLENFRFPELGVLKGARAAGLSRWDWEIYPLSDASGRVTHLLNVVMDVTPPPVKPPRLTKSEQLAENRRREEASGVLRIFGVVPGPESRHPADHLSEREWEVAQLVASGLRNAAIGRQLNIAPTTVSSHIAHILAKLELQSRTQVVAWVLEQRLPLQEQ